MSNQIIEEYFQRFIDSVDGDVLDAAFCWCCQQINEDPTRHNSFKLASRAASYFGLSPEDEFELGERLNDNDSGSFVPADPEPDLGSPGDGILADQDHEFDIVKVKVLA